MTNFEAMIESIVERAVPDDLFGNKPMWGAVLNSYRELARKAVIEAYEAGYQDGKSA